MDVSFKKNLSMEKAKKRIKIISKKKDMATWKPLNKLFSGSV